MGAVSTLKFLLIGEDRMSGALQKAGDTAEKSSKKIGGTSKVMAGLKVAGAAAGLGLAAIFKTGFDEASDASAGTAQLAAGIKSTGNAANVTVDGLNGLAGSIQNYSGQTDDSIVASEKLLLTFTGIHNAAGKNNDIFNQATKATADMAAKMGGDASKYAVQLGKALNDPVKGVTALQKIGVSFTAGQKATIGSMVKMGNTAGAQKIILGELHKEFGGAAKAAGESLPGQLARSKRAFEDVSQSVVTQLMPVIMGLSHLMIAYVMPAFKAVTDFIMSHKGVFLALAGAIGAIVVGMKIFNVVQGVSRVLSGEAAAATGLQTVALGAQKIATGIATAAQWLFNAALDANPIALVVLGIAALTAGIVWLATKTTFFQKLWHATWGAVKRVFLGIVGFIRDHWKIVVSILTGGIGAAVIFIASHWDAIKRGFAGVVSFISGKVTAIVGFIKSIPGRIASVIGAVGKIGERIGAGLWNGLRGVIGDIGGIGKSLYNAVATSVNWLIDKIKNWHFTIGAFGVSHTFQPFGGIPDIPLMAKGGIVTRPTLAIIGEAGPEAVVPLSRGHGFGHPQRSGDTYNITLSVMGDAKSAARVLLTELQRLKGSGTQLNLA